MGTLALVGLGSNLGDRRAILDGAVASLAGTPGIEVRAVSSCHETAPVGGPIGQGPFLNAAAALDVSLSPFDLHGALVRIERDAGRVRVVRWGERTLDLDLLLYGEKIVQTDDLTVPHPRMTTRRFVLGPSVEVAADAVHPVTGWSLARLLQNCDRRPSLLVLRWTTPDRATVFGRVVDALGASAVGDGTWVPGVASAPKGRDEDSLAERMRLYENDLNSLRERLSVPVRSPDQWIVSDRWFDNLYPFILGWISYPSRLWGPLQEAKPPGLAPTLEFRPRGSAEWMFFHADKWSRRKYPLFDHPVLRAESDDPDEVVREVVAACEGTRSRT
jgi:2-amino-4-hydroxy-6-hydroxymethyldihydropteridine diphosphokinase